VVRVDVKEIHPSSHPFGPLRWTRWTLYCTVRLFFPPRHRVSLSAPCIRCQGPLVYASQILCSLRPPSGLIWCESRVLMLKMPPVGVVRSLCPCGCLRPVRFIYECLSSAVSFSLVFFLVCLHSDCLLRVSTWWLLLRLRFYVWFLRFAYLRLEYMSTCAMPLSSHW